MSVPKLRFKEFDEAWKPSILADISNIVTGSTPATSKSEYYDGDFLFVSPADIQENRYVDATKTTLTKEGFNKCRHIPKNSILFVCIGSTIGKIAQNKEICATNQQINAVIPNNYHVSDFLYLVLEKLAPSIKLTAGVQAVPLINKTEFGKTELFTPTLGEQTKIASFLSAVDEKISQHTQKHELLSQYKQGMMQKLFSQQLRFKADDGSEFGEWEDKKLAEVCNFINGRAYKQTEWEKEGIPVIRLQNLTGSGKDYYYSNLNLPNHQYCYNNDLLYMWSATFGPVFWQGEKAIFHYHIWKIEVNPQLLDKKYAYFLLDEMTEKMKRSLNGSTMLHVTKQGMEDTVKTIPSLKEQTKIANFLSAIDQKIEVVAQQIEQAKQWKKGLLQQMFV